MLSAAMEDQRREEGLRHVREVTGCFYFRNCNTQTAGCQRYLPSST